MTVGAPGVDVAVVGGGNAALCAALAARHAGCRVALLERAPLHLRGGNSRHTRDVRYMHTAPSPFVTGLYPEDEFMDDLLRVTGGETDCDLAALAIRESRTIPEWMERHGARWQQPLRGALQLSRTNIFFLGGGKALVNAYYDTAARMGIDVHYEARVVEIADLDASGIGLVIDHRGRRRTLACRAVVVAAGGFEANIEWHRQYWGDAADRFIVRGTPCNDGAVIEALYARGARPVGDPRRFHGVAVDARAPRFDGGIVTRVDSIPFGIAVNAEGRRFYDEGEDLWPKRYAIWGGLIAAQPGQLAYSIFDAKVAGRFIPSAYPPMRADSLPALVAKLDADARTVLDTIAEFNRAAGPVAAFQPGVLDACATSGLTPPKSHWALPIDTPPFYAYPLRPGITFTYRGVAVDRRARVLTPTGAPLLGVYAAGECMAGNILSRGYLAGFGLTIGTVFGRIAGEEAARYARG